MSDIVFIEDDQATPPAAAAAPCPHCGSPLVGEERFCSACGGALPGAEPRGVAEPVEELACRGCGSRFAVTAERRSYVCPYCETAYVLELVGDGVARAAPEFVIGFTVTPEQALEKFRAWLRTSGWFRPGDLVRQAHDPTEFHGVYFPFWRLTALLESTWRAQIGEYWYRTETYTTTDSKGNTVTRTRQVRETEWWPLSGRFHQFVYGYLVEAGHQLTQPEVERVFPYQLEYLRRYEPRYVAGWPCEQPDIDQPEAFARGRAALEEMQRRAITGFLPGDTHSGLTHQTRIWRESADLCLLPLYTVTYRYQGKPFRFLVNGQTGRVAGDMPVSWRRIGAAIGAGLVLFAIVLAIVFFATR